MKVTLNQFPVQRTYLYFLRTAWSSVKFPFLWKQNKCIRQRFHQSSELSSYSCFETSKWIRSWGTEGKKLGEFPIWFPDFSFTEMSICRNPNRRSQEHEKKKKKKRQRRRQMNYNFQSGICRSPVIFPFSAIYTRTHTRGHRHGSLSAGPLHSSTGDRQGPGAGGRAGTGAGILFWLNSEQQMHFPKSCLINEGWTRPARRCRAREARAVCGAARGGEKEVVGEGFIFSLFS